MKTFHSENVVRRESTTPRRVIRTSEKTAEIIAAIERDLPLKAVAIDCGISGCNIHRLATQLGYRRMFVSLKERAKIMRERQRSPRRVSQ